MQRRSGRVDTVANGLQTAIFLSIFLILPSLSSILFPILLSIPSCAITPYLLCLSFGWWAGWSWCADGGCSTIIITMTTKWLVAGQGMALRSTRRLPALPPVLTQCPPLPCSSIDSQPSENDAPLLDHDDLIPKIEKESTSPLRRAPSASWEIGRRVTRSRANSTAKPDILLSNTLDLLSGNEGSALRREERPPAKKEKEAPHCNNPPPATLLPADPLPPRKNPQKPPSLQPVHTPSRYGEFRKSYRKIARGQVLSFPYRKCHDQLEGKITAILNKLTADRDCRKEMEALAERLARAGSREMRNRYVVAGVRMAIRLAKEREGAEGRLLARLQSEEKAFQGRISEELSDFSQFEDHPHRVQRIDPSDTPGYQALIMKKLYSTLKRTHPQHSKNEIRRRVVAECQGFFAGEVSMDEMVKFVRKRLEG